MVVGFNHEIFVFKKIYFLSSDNKVGQNPMKKTFIL